MVWTNSDGLRVSFHRELGATTKAGEYATPANGDQHVLEWTINMTSLGTSSAVMDEFQIIPSGAFIEKVELIPTVAVTSGGSAALNVGFNKLDRTTAIDADGLIAAGALATFDAVGETVTYVEGSTAHGALIGTAMAFPGVLVADYDTAAFTAGTVKIKVYYSMHVTG